MSKRLKLFKASVFVLASIFLFGNIDVASEFTGTRGVVEPAKEIAIEIFDSPEAVSQDIIDALGELISQDIVYVEGVPILFENV